VFSLNIASKLPYDTQKQLVIAGDMVTVRQLIEDVDATTEILDLAVETDLDIFELGTLAHHPNLSAAAAKKIWDVTFEMACSDLYTSGSEYHFVTRPLIKNALFSNDYIISSLSKAVEEELLEEAAIEGLFAVALRALDIPENLAKRIIAQCIFRLAEVLAKKDSVGIDFVIEQAVNGNPACQNAIYARKEEAKAYALNVIGDEFAHLPMEWIASIMGWKWMSSFE